MALFQKNQESTTINKLFSMGLTKNILIVGLGNPGKEYVNTRHNIGFDCVDNFAAKNGFTNWQEKKSLKSLIINGTLGETRVLIIKPTTFMNDSGIAVRSVMDFYKIHPAQIVVVHDEIDITFGQIRTRLGGSSAGHNGIKSIISHVSEDFERIRVGIGPKTPSQIDSSDFVLAKFSKDQSDDLGDLKLEVTSILTERVYADKLHEETRNFII